MGLNLTRAAATLTKTAGINAQHQPPTSRSPSRKAGQAGAGFPLRPARTKPSVSTQSIRGSRFNTPAVEEQITAAMRHLPLAGRLVVEPAGAVATAAWLHDLVDRTPGPTAAIVSGRSIDPHVLVETLM